MKGYMFLFSKYLPKIQIKMDVKKINHRPTVCIKHLIDEPRLRRRFQINVLHLGRGNLSKLEIQKEIGKKFGLLIHKKYLFTVFVHMDKDL